MRLAESSVPMKKSQTLGQRDGGYGEPFFCDGCERALALLSYFPSGKIALVCDEAGYELFAPFAQRERVISLLFHGEGLSLFSLPDGVVAVIAAGDGALLRAARYFCAVQKIACYLCPREVCFCGVFERAGEVNLGGSISVQPLKEGEVWCDLSYLKGYARALSRNLLARIALFEQRALQWLTGGEGINQALFSILQNGCGEGKEAVLAISYARARVDTAGEGLALANLLGGEFPEWRAAEALIAVYGAFFASAPPLYLAPRYVSLTPLTLAQKKKIRTAFLEGERLLLREFTLVKREKERCERAFLLLGGRKERGESFSAVKELPARVPNGLCAVIKHFGLLE